MSTTTQRTTRPGKTLLGSYVDVDLYGEFATIAHANERPVAAELRIAVRRHIDAARVDQRREH